MKIGIISDTHDNLPMLRKAIEEFHRRGIETVLHCGDIVAPFAVKELQKGKFKVCRGVFGNNDGEVLMLHRFFSEFGTLTQPPYWFEVEGLRIALFHEPLPVEAMACLPCDLVAFGHTHEVMVKKGKPLVVNPGECCGYVSGRATIAIADTEEGKAEIIELG